MDRVSIVIPCHNPEPYLLDAVASARSQDYPEVELILVSDGTTTAEGLELLRTAARPADRLLEQEHQGLAAARNAGFRSATGRYVVLLDADDLLEPGFVSECVLTLAEHPEAGFVYSDYLVFGAENYVERLPDYNLYRLLERNPVRHTALIRRADWEAAGGYDHAMNLGYEDWDLWLRLAEQGRLGHHIAQVLFRHRKQGRSVLTCEPEHREELVQRLRGAHPRLYGYQERARIKARWEPAVVVLGGAPEAPGILDWQALESGSAEEALRQPNAAAFVYPAPGGMDSDSLEFAALAVWGGHERLRLADGSLAVSRRGLKGGETAETPAPIPGGGREGVWPGPVRRIQRHLANAGLLSWKTWREHPMGAAARLIPLGVKERVNQALGRPLFDLTFYLRFQPRALVLPQAVVEPLQYFPPAAWGRRRIALVTPHLGPGGAEQVLLEIAGCLDRKRFEIFVFATHSHDGRWLARWQGVADHIYDLGSLVTEPFVPAAICSVAGNWDFNTVLVQNTLIGYSAMPGLRRALPFVKIMDLIHAVDEAGDVVSATAAVGDRIETRVVISEVARRRVLASGTPEERLQLIRNGVDLQRFQPGPPRVSGTARILFAGRLDPVKRPLLLVEIAQALLRRGGDFRMVVAGDGPEGPKLRKRLRREGLTERFDLMGSVEDLAPVLADADIVVVPSRVEGIPLVVLEAMASGKPVVASRVGAIHEVLDDTHGFLVERGRGEAERFAACLHALMSDADLRERLGWNGRLRAEAECDIEKAREMYRALFE